MHLKPYTLYFFLFFITCTFSQKKSKETLLTIDGQEVSVNEFLSVYNKNLDMVQDENQKDKEAYLDLFINYKLKTKEAYAQGLHTSPTFIKEFGGYQKQLSENYLYEQDVTEDLIKEAYARSYQEVNANHILILVSQDAKPQDTLIAYTKIKDILAKAKSGQDFEELARTYSEEPNAKETAGNLGYFKGFSMVYPFENAAYATPVGEISDILRTTFGYHILKVNNKREVPNEVTTAHIMISTSAEHSEEEAEKRINDIYKKVRQGEDFGALAIQFSEDSSTSKNNGELARFGSGRLNAPEFEKAAFALKNPGDYSEPVKTAYGWHIIKLIERHPKQTFEESKPELYKKVKSNERSKIVIETVNQRIKDKYGFNRDRNALAFFNTYVTDSILKRKWVYENHPTLKTTLFTIGYNKYTYDDFAKFIEQRQTKSKVFQDKDMLLNIYYEDFEGEKLMHFFTENLEKDNEEYASLIAEYRNGLLIYDLMQKNIWEPSKNDTLGLNTYFNANRENYRWKSRVKASIGATADPQVARQIQQMMQSGKSNDEITATLNTHDKVQAIMTTGVYEPDHQALPENFTPKKGISEVYAPTGNKDTKIRQYIVVDVEEILPAAPKTLEEVKGKVASDFQTHLEAEWMKELREKYVVKVNKKALK